MTEKELMYLEDACEHEKSIIGICNDFLGKVDDEYKTFFENQITNHEKIQN